MKPYPTWEKHGKWERREEIIYTIYQMVQIVSQKCQNDLEL